VKSLTTPHAVAMTMCPACGHEVTKRDDEAKALLEESVEIAERYGHLVAAQRARDRLAAGL
jgi:hypothetical protein